MGKGKEIGFTIPEDIYEDLNKFRQDHNMTWRDFFIASAKAYIRIYGVEKTIPIKDIEESIYIGDDVAHCARCGREIKKGYTVYVIRNWGILCKHCATELKVESGLARLDREKLRLQKEIQVLRREKRKLQEALNEAEARKKILDIAAEIEKISKEMEKKHVQVLEMMRRWFTMVGSKNEDLVKIQDMLERNHEEIQEWISETRNKLEEIAATMGLSLTVSRKRKKKDDTIVFEWGGAKF
jgi:hypothetical protein